MSSELWGLVAILLGFAAPALVAVMLAMVVRAIRRSERKDKP